MDPDALLHGIYVASRYKVARPLRTKQAKDVAKMTADIYKVGPLIPRYFSVTVAKHEIKIRRVTKKYKHTHRAFVEALNKILAEQLFKVQAHKS